MARAAKKIRSIYVCQQCGHNEGKWTGRCAQCGEWNSMVEELAEPTSVVVPSATDGRRPLSIATVDEMGARDRLVSGISELDRVLGGGLVPGSLVLLGGEPGMGINHRAIPNLFFGDNEYEGGCLHRLG
jgi:DNA repair protein RadA/Sms